MFDLTSTNAGTDTAFTSSSVATRIAFREDHCHWTFEQHPLGEPSTSREVSVQDVLSSIEEHFHDHVISVTRANVAAVAGDVLIGKPVAAERLLGMRDLRKQLQAVA
jgi:site-specific recombinase